MARETLHDASSNDAAIPKLGELFAGRYRVEALLGRGGMGTVFCAHDCEVDELVALKILNVAALSPAALERFRREVRLARRVTHRHVARTYDLGEHGGVRYLTMEYIDGVSLRQWLRERPSGRLSPSEAVDVALQVAAGLSAAHAAGIVHRDLKPGNILIERLGNGPRVVIGDFGIARTTDDERSTSQTQAMLGTPAYMAPEQVEGKPVDARTDLYALGLILVEMLSGTLPFAGDNPFALALARLAQPQPDLEQLAGIPAELLEPLRRCLTREPGARFASVTELAAALTGAATQLDVDTLVDGPAASHDTHPTPHASEEWGAPLERTPTSSRALPARAKALAVLPFRYRGPADDSFVADALLDELTDVLAMTRGLKVLATGALAGFADAGDRDPRVLGSELAVDVVVDGTVQLAGTRLRVAARLLDVHTGFQLWSERFDGELGDVFEVQDKLGQRIAEALRVELEVIGHGGLDDPDALESYLRARQAKLRWRLRGPDGAVHHYREVLARAPDFRPAIAGLALALMRAWFMPGERDEDELDWPREAKLAVERAMVEAPDFPESRIAIASWLVQGGDYRAAAEHLREALRIAPTCALAHEYLGRLQMEAAQPDKGLRHLELALELDPRLEWCHADIARYRALQADMHGYREHMDELLARSDRLHVAAHLYEMRVGAWIRDLDSVRRALAQIDAHSPNNATRTMRAYGPPLLEPRYDGEALASFHARAIAGVENGRLRTLLFQLWSEQTAFWADRERTLAHLEAAADLVLVDLAWLDACPLFEFVRDEPRFVALRARVRSRCEAIWASS